MMKSLSLETPLVIVTVGLPGAGKSFFAAQFSDMFAAPLISYNRICSELFTQPTYAKAERDIIARVACLQYEQLLKTGKTIVVDGGGATRAKRHELSHTAKKSGYNTLYIWVQVDPKTAEQRSTKLIKNRAEGLGKTTLSSEQFAAELKRFSPPAPSEKYFVISGKHTFATQARTILGKLAPVRETNPARSDDHTTSADTSLRRRNITIR